MDSFAALAAIVILLALAAALDAHAPQADVTVQIICPAGTSPSAADPGEPTIMTCKAPRTVTER